MRVVGYHISDKLIANSDGELCKEPPFIDFLLQPKLGAIKIFYYLSQDMANLAKLCKMTEAEVKLIHDSNQDKAFMPPYKIRYVKDRFLNIQKGFYGNSPYCYIYDAHQYVDTEAVEKESESDSIEKANEAASIGEQVFMTFHQLGLDTDRLISPIRALEDKVLKKLSLPTIKDIPDEAGFYAYECCVGNWLEAFQIGYWNQVYDYDINSAYPAEIAKLWDIRNGKWVKDNQYIKEAVYGYCDGIVNMWAKFHPVIYRAGERNNLPQNYTPTGIWPTKLNKRMMNYIQFRNLGEFKIENGWWWIPEGKQSKPFEQTILWLYGEKETSKGLKKDIIKRNMAGIYGKTLEARNNTFGELFNPVYGAEIETGTRIAVSEFVLKNGIIPIHIAVDGVISSEKVQLQDTLRLGDWRLSNISPCICAGTGNVALADDVSGDFHLEYGKLRKLIEENPEAKEYKLSKKTPVTISEAVNGYGIEKLGKLKEIYKYVDILEENKRSYKNKPKNGGELLAGNYGSEPLDVSLVANLLGGL